MGEALPNNVSEEKKPEEPKKTEEEKKKEEEEAAAEKPAEESKAEEAAPAPAPPPEIVLKVFMHCEGCARKVRRSLKGFPGVDDVVTDCKSRKVVVKGEKADPLKVLERIQRKSHSKVELLSPIPKPQQQQEEDNKVQEEEKPKPRPEEKKEEPPIVTVLKVHMHCEACSQEIKRRIQRMKGVESAEPDLKNSQVSVKGVYDPAKLVEYVYKRTGKKAVIVKQEVEKKEKVEEAKEEKKEEGEKEKKSDEGEEKKEEEAKGEAKAEAAATTTEASTEDTNKVVAEVKINEYFYNPQRHDMEVYAYPAHPAYPAYYQEYPPQIFSDENPNACTVM